jgi:hypothetical protein
MLASNLAKYPLRYALIFFKENIRGTRMSLFKERMMTNDDVTPVSIKKELQFAGEETSRSIVISQIKQKQVITQAYCA